MFKLAGPRWRFELFYFDFAIGAVLFSVLAAYTFGSLGADMDFGDRIVVAGRTAQATAMLAGCLFNVGNMLLLSAVALLGIASAFPLSIGLAIAVGALFAFSMSNILYLVFGIVLMIVALFVNTSAIRLRNPAPPAPGTKGTAKNQISALLKRTKKGLIIAVIAGVALGLSFPALNRVLVGDFGLGPYAAVLLFCIGMAISTLILNFYFMNIAIEGGRLTFNDYLKGKPRQHFLGFAGGAIWALGALTALLPLFTPPHLGVGPALIFILPLISALVAIFWGVYKWKEFAAAPRKARLSLALTAAVFFCSLVLLGLGVAS
jgi:glucose uptake protein